MLSTSGASSGRHLTPAEDEVRRAETQFGTTSPAEYRDYLLHHNSNRRYLRRARPAGRGSG